MERWRFGFDAAYHALPYQPGAQQAFAMVKLVNPERFNRLPDAILFDTDDTLYKYAPAHAAAMQAVREKVTRTLSIQPEAFDKAFAEARQQVKSRLKHT